jgi:hypothetical protein
MLDITIAGRTPDDLISCVSDYERTIAGLAFATI